MFRKNERYKIKIELLVVHIDRQPEDAQFWHVVVPNDGEIKWKILNECHTVLYSAHPDVQRTLNKLRQKYYWKGQTNDVKDVVNSCIICQTGDTLSKR